MEIKKNAEQRAIVANQNKKEKKYWLEKMAGEPVSVGFPYDRNRKDQTGERRAAVGFEITGESYHRQIRMSGSTDQALHMIQVAAVVALLDKYSYKGRNDIIVGTPVYRQAGISSRDLINTVLPLRIAFTGEMTFKELLLQVRQAVIEGDKHQNYPMEQLIRQLGMKDEADGNPLFDVAVQLENIHDKDILPGIDHALTVSFRRIPGKIEGRLEYRTRHYRESTVARIAQHLANLLENATAAVDVPLKEICVQSEEERRRLLIRFNDNEAEFPREKSIYRFIEDIARREPGRVSQQMEDRYVTYAHMNARANRLARELKACGVERDQPVGILMERGPRMMESIVAVWKAGGAYIPVDTQYPERRIKEILKDSASVALITENRHVGPGVEDAFSGAVIRLDSEAGKIECRPDADLERPHDMNSLSYIIYTSGSTGKPKGAMVEHIGMMNHIQAKIDDLQLTSESVVAQNATHTFDISVWQYFVAQVTGGKTVIYGNKRVLEPGRFMREVEKNNITILEVVPSYLSVMLSTLEITPRQFKRLHYLLVTGEAVKPDLVKRWFETYPGIKMVNAYGPTEASDDITHLIMDRAPETEQVPIGKPLHNFNIYIVDRYMKLCPQGVSGEICVSGVGVGRGYIRDEERTRNAFMEDPFSTEKGVRLYKTGDLGRWLPDGNIDFQGRIDHQVKIRGFRIELGEIENALMDHPPVSEVVVTAREDKNKNSYLAAYIVSGERISAPEIKAYLEKQLPEYMVPAYIMQMDRLPLSASGKVDRKVLPNPEEEGTAAAAANYIAPETPTETTLVEIWQEILELEKIGTGDNFFDLGGDSIKGMRIINQIQQRMGEIMHVARIFEAPTIKELAAGMDAGKKWENRGIDDAALENFRKIIPRRSPIETGGPKNPPAAFILSSPRTGSTLLRVILAGHPGIFAPPELELLQFNTLQERKNELSGNMSYFAEGTIRAQMEIEGSGPEEAKARMEDYERQDLTVKEYYRRLQEGLEHRLLVDKTANYALSLQGLQRAEQYFEETRYIHLTRHPYAVINSYIEAKLDQVFRYEHDYTRRELAELVWQLSEKNIEEFLEGVPDRRKHCVKYEDLLENPAAEVRAICEFLGITYRESMLEVYRNTDRKMTDGIYAESRMIGDVKFFRHTTIDRAAADRWKKNMKDGDKGLGETSRRIARRQGYRIDENEMEKNSPAPAPAAGNYPLSHAQKRLWILDQFQGAKTAYNITAAYILEGDLDRGALENAYETMVRRHETLRTVIVPVDGEPRQKIHEPGEQCGWFRYIDKAGAGGTDIDVEAEVAAEAAAPFDLAEGPLVRARLIRLESRRYMFVLSMHHIISDGWSMGILVKEMMTLYRANRAKQPHPLPPLEIQYKDYAVWQEGEPNRENHRRQAEYWQRLYEGEIPVLDLPADNPRPEVQHYEGAALDFQIGKEDLRRLRELAARTGTTQYMVQLALYGIFLSKLSNQREIVVGTPVAGRGHPQLEPIIGMFVNTLALKQHIDTGKTVLQHIGEITGQTLEAFANQDYPYEDLVERLGVKRDTGRNPLFDVMFAMQNQAVPQLEIPGIRLTPVEQAARTSKFEITLHAEETRDGMTYRFEYRTKQFENDTIRRYAEMFKTMVTGAAADPGTKIADIEIITEEEKHWILNTYNQPVDRNAAAKSLVQMMQTQTEKTPDAVALVSRENRQKGTLNLTYRELNKTANRLARRLRETGAAPGDIVAVKVERSVEMLQAIIAILKARCTYLPIDPGYPGERVRYMKEDSGCRYIVVRSADDCTGESKGVEIPVRETVAHGNDRNQALQYGPEDRVYQIYTSGSTGKPKGAVIRQRGFVNLVNWYVGEFGLNEEDAYVMIAPISFDLAQKNLYAPLVTGGRLCLPPAGLPDYRRMTRFIAEERQTVINCAPTVFYPLVELNGSDGHAALKSLRYVFLGGESIQMEKLAPWKNAANGKCEIVNTYGPTECTDVVSSYRIPAEKSKQPRNIPVGKPLPNVTLYVMDANRRHQPVGVPGELCIGGIGLSPGYVNRPEQTNDRFVPSPHPGEERIYRTGDQTRWKPDGNIEFLGRIDHQVKVRGQRIELGEIENRMLRHHRVKDAVVKIIEDNIRGNYLCGYIVPEKDETGDPVGEKEIKTYLAQYLPDYMVPAYILHQDSLPLTPSGKVDRRQLPQPAGRDADETKMAPRTATEERLTVHWAELLGQEQTAVGIDDDFFDNGGHSLRATILAAKIHKEFGVHLPLEQIFRTPDIRRLAEAVDKTAGNGIRDVQPAEKKETYPLTSAQKRMYLLHRMNPQGIDYNIPLLAALEGKLDERRLEDALLQLIRRHESLRTGFQMKGDEPVQRIYDQVDFKIEKDEIITDEANPHDPTAAAIRVLRGKIQPFDLTQPPLMRVMLLKQTAAKHYLQVDMHHIISDGTSMEIIIDELMRAYAGDTLAPLRLQYKDIARWQNSGREKDVLHRQEAYWLEQFSGQNEIPVLALPLDRPRPAVQVTEGDRVAFEVGPRRTAALKRRARIDGLTPFMQMQTAFAITLAKLAGQDDIVVGTPVAGRRHADQQGIIGMFINTLAMRNRPAGHKTIAQFQQEVKTNALKAFENQEYPFEELVEKLNLTRDAGRNPLFDVMQVHQNMETNHIQVPGLKLEPIDQEIGAAKFDLTLHVVETGDILQCGFQYAARLFDRGTLQRWTENLKRVIETMTEHPEMKIREIDIRTGAEKRRIRERFNRTDAPYPADKSLHRMFEEQRQRTPHRVAQVDGASGSQITYEELDRQARRQAETLRRCGVGPGSIVAIITERTPRMMTGLMAILKTGAAYMPIDPAYPAERIRYMLADSGARHVTVGKEIPASILRPLKENHEVIMLQEQEETEPGGIGNTPEDIGSIREPAYILYTSGSTGRPKGVVVEHRSVVNLLCGQGDAIPTGPNDRVLLKTSIQFDVSVTELYGWTINGGTQIILEHGAEKNPGAIIGAVAKYGVTHLNFVPAMFNIYIESLKTVKKEDLRSLKMIILAGEELLPEQVKQFRRLNTGIRLENQYGPTENTVYTTRHQVRPGDGADGGRIPIGKPLPNIRLDILDRNGKSLGIGVPGELHIAGDSLAAGYLNNPELTADRFPRYPRVKNGTQDRFHRAYKTGDRARWLPDGSVQFLGRIDQQVKVRGYRIELGEIEAQLLAREGVTEAVAVVATDNAGDKYICAYVVSEKTPQELELREKISQVLPEYMVPAYIVPMETLPLTVSGKVDRRALPAPELAENESVKTYPRTRCETVMAEIWAEVLGREPGQLGIDEDFFKIGGHSLKAAAVLTRVHRRQGVNLPLSVIFAAPTIRTLALKVEEKDPQNRRERFQRIPEAEKKEKYPLSPAQNRLFMLNRLAPDTTGYNLPALLEIGGNLDVNRLENVFRQLIRRHESLRTSFGMENRQPLQYIHPAVSFQLERWDAADTQRLQRFVRPFDLSEAPLLRVGLAKITEEKYILMIDMHHIIADGTAAGILVKEFAALYNGGQLPPLEIQYRDVSEWQNSPAQKQVVNEQKEYWFKQYEDRIPVLEIPLDKPRPVIQSFQGRSERFQLTEEETETLKEAALREGVTPYIYQLSMYALLLSKHSGREDIVIGTPVAGRKHQDQEKIIGMFVNTLPVRIKIDTGHTFRQYLAAVKEQVLGAFANQDYPYEELVEQLPVNRDTGRNPLFDVMFVMQNQDSPSIELPGLTITPITPENKTAKFDLLLEAVETAEGIRYRWEYSSDIFLRETVLRIIRRYKTMLTGLTGQPDRRIAETAIITEEEKKQVMERFNDTAAGLPREKTIIQLFRQQAEREPHRLALVGRDAAAGEEVTLTYRALNERANRLARRLRERGQAPGGIVAIQMERTLNLMVAVFAIQKTGSAYMPIAPDTPPERTRVMLADTGAKRLLTDNGKKSPDTYDGEIIDIADETLYRGPGENPEIEAGTGDPAYIIYTSGSTGGPKGVMVEHRAVVNLLYGQGDSLPVEPADRILMKTNTVFDVSVAEIYGWIPAGAGQVHLEKGAEKNPEAITEAVAKYGITHINYVPAMFNVYVETLNANDIGRLKSLKTIVLAGEELRPETVKAFQELNTGIRLENQYGPTENTVYTTKYIIKSGDGTEKGKIPIGKPLPNIRLHIRDQYGNLQGIGIPGELYITGDGLAAGYLNNPGLTAEKFDRDTADPRKRFYKTGDSARWLPDGNIEFLGRIDQQVKVRGYRIELGEIEGQLQAQDGVTGAVVAAKTDEAGDKYLCAYIVSEKTPQQLALKEKLSLVLPAYMVPAHIVRLQTLPLTPGGKVNRRALPEPEAETGRQKTAPRDEIETIIARQWALQLGPGIENIGIDDNFFHYGGHSLKAIQAAEKIRQQFDVPMTVADIFKTPTIRGLAQIVNNTGKEKYQRLEPAEEKEYYPLSTAQRRLVVLHRLDEENGGTGYNMPSVSILEGTLDKEKVEKTFRRLVQRHETLRTSIKTVGRDTVQVIHETVDFHIEHHRLDQTGSPGEIAEKREMSIRTFIRPFDLTEAPLLRVGLIEEEQRKYILMVDMHHIISDGISVSRLTEEFLTGYAGETLPPLRLQYKDICAGRSGEKEQTARRRREEYWKRQFDGEIPVLTIPTDYPRPKVQGHEGNTLYFTAEEQHARALKKLAKEENATLFMVLQAVYSVFLSKLSGQEDIVLGTPVSGRSHADQQNIIGLFVNTLALRNAPAGEKTVREYLGEIREKTVDAFANQDYPYEELVEAVTVSRDTSRNPLFDVMLVVQNMEISQRQIPGLRLKPYRYGNTASKFDMTLYAVENDETLAFSLEYAVKLFEIETVRRYIGYLKTVLAAIGEKPDGKIGEIGIISEEEKKRIRDRFNGTEADNPLNKTILDFFEEQTLRTPERVAVTYTGTAITYRELNRRAAGRARSLREHGVEPGDIVAIQVERSIEMIEGIYAALKTGGAYLPIEPSHPLERRRYVLESSNSRVLMTRGQYGDEPADICPVIHLDEIPETRDQNDTYRRINVTPADKIYVLYTSGSTGKPKGVILEHRSVVNTLWTMQKRYPLTAGDNYLMKTSYCFDVSVTEIFGWNFDGGRLTILEADAEKDHRKIIDTVAATAVTHINFSPTALNTLVEQLNADDIEKMKGLKYIFSMGEDLLPGVVKDYREKLPAIRLENLYGPTEAAIYVSGYSLSQWPGTGPVPIGKPLDNIRFYILDKYGHQQPLGVVGELYVGGVGVARGYINQPEHTHQTFVYKSVAPGGRLYRTGDLARWQTDGNVQYLGRIDHQVKIRGYRIELGEIESRLQSHEAVTAAVAVVREPLNNEAGQADKYICAYIVSDTEPEPSALKDFLAQHLPYYMVPGTIMQLDAFPLTTSGKIDRKALPEPERLIDNRDTVSPRDKQEEKLAEIWARVLGIPVELIGIDNDFFQMGGHSLKANSMTLEIYRELETRVPLSEVFKTSTIRGLSEYIKRQAREEFAPIEPVERKENYRMSYAQKRLFFLEQLGNTGTVYSTASTWLIEGGLEKQRLQQAFREMIRRHESLRTSFELINGEPRQIIHPTMDFQIKTMTVNRDMRDYEIEIKGLIENFIQPFRLNHPPLVRATLITFDAQKYLFLLDMHHIITDGVSGVLFMKELMEIYRGKEPQPLRVQYKDYSEWQNSEAGAKVLRQEEQYWLDMFKGDIPVLELATDYPRPAVQTFEGASVHFTLEEEITQRLKEMTERTGTTINMVLMAVYIILLSRYSEQEDLVVGLAISGRNHPDLEQIIGFFVNSLAIRTQPEGEKTFEQYLKEVKQVTLQGYENQGYPFDELVKKLGISSDLSRNPLFNVLFTTQNMSAGEVEIPGIKITPYGFEQRVSRFDFQLLALESGKTVEMELEYTTALFKPEWAKRFTERYESVLRQVMEDDAVKLKDIVIMHRLGVASAPVFEAEALDFDL